MTKQASSTPFVRSFLRQLVGLAVLAVCALASQDSQALIDELKPGSKQTRQLQQCRSISEILCETDVFDSFCGLMNGTGLEDLLEDEDFQWTVFAPTNSALEDFDTEFLFLPTNDTDIQDDDPLTDLLTFHMVSDQVVTGSQLECGDTLVMDNGGETTVLCGDENANSVYLVGEGNNQDIDSNEAPRVAVTDVVACNGIIHVIDNVLLDGDGSSSATTASNGAEPDQKPKPESELPVCQSIQEVVCDMDDLSAICSYLDDESILTLSTSSDNLWTLFAPTDEAFEYIEDYLGPLEPEAVMDVLKYQTIEGEELFSDDLVCESDLIMGNGKSSFTTCSRFSGDVYQKGPGNRSPRTPRIIESDKTACNGVVHVVNYVILPELTSPPFSLSGKKYEAKSEKQKNERRRTEGKQQKSILRTPY